MKNNNQYRSKQQPILLAAAFIVLLGRTHASWVDPDTPEEFRTTQALVESDNREFALVFSDEFETEGRTFNDGTDPRWTALNKNDYTNDALHYYSHDNVRTSNGVLNITTEKKTNLYKAFDEKTKKFFADQKYIQSGMLQGWNKFCITGGIVEFSAKLPGDPFTGGLWPALWLLGNLARASYVGSSDYMWPYSYNKCDDNVRHSQEINACSKVGHYGLETGLGRGAPEIDILETMQGDRQKLPHTHVRRPYLSCSFQVAPGITESRPRVGQLPHEDNWYSPLEYGNKTGAALNPFFYGVTLVHEPKSFTYQSDALSANMPLNESHYQNQHLYRVEWDPPEEDGTGGYIKWFVDNELMYGVFGQSLSITDAEIPSEPMYLLMNTAVSKNWGFPAPCPDGCKCECFECGNPDCACALPPGYCENTPAYMEIDYIRVYQAVNEPKHQLGCSTKTRPTDTFIKGHAERYTLEGQKRPLEPVRRGGAICSVDTDCGASVCPDGRCECVEGFTGPLCLAHDGSYDDEDTKEIPPFNLSQIYLPNSLILIIATLIIGFGCLLMGIIQRRKKDASYAKLPNGQAGPASNDFSACATSYHNPGSTDYALPTNQKVVTYCVIDGRLIDE